MANPFKERAGATAKTKFGAMGQPKALAKHTDSGESKAEIKKVAKGYDLKAPGYASGGRLDKYARGGKVKGKTTINIDLGAQAQPQPVPVPVPMPPPGPPAGAAPPMPPPPPGPPGGLMPPSPIPSPMTGMPPPMPPPTPPAPNAGSGMPRFKSGGKVKYIAGKPTDNALKRWGQYARRNSYVK
jgi:hypothetical protein